MGDSQPYPQRLPPRPEEFFAEPTHPVRLKELKAETSDQALLHESKDVYRRKTVTFTERYGWYSMGRVRKRDNKRLGGKERLSGNFVSLCNQGEACRSNFSDVGRRIFEPLLQAFSGYVLPHRADDRPTFTDSDCRLYVNKREWLARVVADSIPEENRYEHLMEALFWGVGPFSDLVSKRKLIFISGTIGSGKSTFTDYYLRCYCPNRSQRAPQFEEKLILHFDLKNRTSRQAIDDKMWRDIEHSLRRAGIDPSLVANFDAEMEPSQRKILRALEKISKLKSDGILGNKKYLIFVVDNIDQSPNDCQAHCLMLIQDIIQVDSKVDPWKIVFPLWPQTLSRLRRESRLTVKETEYFEIELGHLDLSDFYRRKIDYLNENFRDGDAGQASRMLKEVTFLAKDRYSTVLRGLSYGNFLTMDDLIVNLLRSRELAEHESRESSEHLSDYRFYDSLITGVNEYHCVDSSGILNPLGWHKSPNDEFSVLIAPYLMQYLSDSSEHQLSSVLDYFTSIGCRRALVEEAVHKLAEYHLLHIESDDMLNPHRKTIDAYRKLLEEPAVLDNFAHTTPVRQSSINSQWVRTKGYIPSQFFDRCRTTLLFIKEISNLENKIDAKAQDRGVNVDEFRSKIPRLGGRLAYYYRLRLSVAKENNWPVRSGMTAQQWEVLENA